MLTNLEHVGTYVRQTFKECAVLGVSAVSFIAIMSMFMGAVASIEIYHILWSPFKSSNFLLGYGVRQMAILQIAPTVMAIILAGRAGSSIASQIGAMRISGQIDALEILGINSASYLSLPKILASLLVYPMLVIFSAFVCICSGLFVAKFAVAVSPEEYIQGLRYNFDPLTMYIALTKSAVYAFLIASIASYRGYYVSGGSEAIGRASTNAVTESCIAILATDYIFMQLLSRPFLSLI